MPSSYVRAVTVPARWPVLLLGAAVLLFLVACGGGDQGSGTFSPEDSVPVDGQAVRRYFAQNCSACHGLQREGRAGPALTPEHLTQDDAYYADVIANGRARMPAWGGRLTAQDIDTLVHWLKTTSPGGD